MLGDSSGKRKRWTTASRLERAVLCPASTVLPEVESKSGNSAIFGSAWHQVVELGRLGECESRGGVRVAWPGWVSRAVNDKLANLPRAFEEIREEYWPSGEGRTHELKAQIDGANFEVASLLVDGGSYAESETSIRFKIDYVGEKLGLPWIDDLKTGRDPGEPDSLQVAAAALLIVQVRGAEGAYTSKTHWPRYPKHGEPSREWHFHDVESLEQVRKVLKVVREDALSPPPTVNAAKDEYGEPVGQCRYCNCRPNCPAWKGV